MSGAHHQFAIYGSHDGDRILWRTYSDRHRALTALHGLRHNHKGIAWTLEGHDK